MKHRETIDLNSDAIHILKTNQLLLLYEQLGKGGRNFINKAIRINQDGEPFTYADFEGSGKDRFKQYVYNLRHAGLIEVIEKSSLAYYRVKGFRLKAYWEKLTTKATGVSIRDTERSSFSTENILQFLKDYLRDLDYPALHNIRLHFYDDYLYHTYEQMKEKLDPIFTQYIPRNKSFIIRPDFRWEPYCSAQIILTPNKLVQIIIKNTFKPIAYDENGIYELNVKLGEIREYLRYYSNDIPRVSNWLFVRADFGRDCKRPLNKLFPAMEFRDLTGALVRLYAKEWPDGTSRLRLEKNISPNKPMEVIPEILAKETIAPESLFQGVNQPV